jgi:hypothetical protein
MGEIHPGLFEDMAVAKDTGPATTTVFLGPEVFMKPRCITIGISQLTAQLILQIGQVSFNLVDGNRLGHGD